MAKKVRGTGFRRRLLSLLAMGTVALGVLSVLGLGVLGLLYRKHVVVDPGPHIARSHIQTVIAQESPVYYRDGVTRVGVFFEDEHREYVPWQDLPPAYVTAIVAAEDGHYWTHPGVSLPHIAKAMLKNLRTGDIVAGGSTLTQQTAKNIYYRPDRSLRSKWTELLNALRLEAHYDKEEILTFYVNQFHVSGNGRGLGIAARYFFDKDVSEVTVLESAFLAGLVKAPSYYDPFIGDEDRRARSLERAHDRARYVLRRIVEEDAERLAGPIPGKPDASRAERLAAVGDLKAEAARLLESEFELPFRKGTFRYDSSAVLDEVARRLHEAPFDAVLAEAGIEDPATAGLVVITTLDLDVEREAIYSLWHHLTEVGTMLEGHTAADFVRTDARGPRYSPEPPGRHEFAIAEVSGVIDPTGRTHFKVDLGGHECLVDRDAVVRAALWVHRGQKKSRYAKVPTEEVDAFARSIAKGAVVWVSVREVSEDARICDLELRPELQGAAMVLEEGQVRAMVGGNDNRNFNRSTALRQMGSTWKPLIYHAAMELGWSPADELDNRRTAFPFSTTFYYPRPDHTPQPVVSMAWAGVNSENLASIWLLYHLTDDLNSEQIRVLAESLGMARGPDESMPDYRTRVQKMGVLPTSRRVEESFFLQARQEVASGLALQGHPEDALALKSLLYGWGFEAERARVQREGSSTRAWKERALDNSWLTLEPMLDRCEDQYTALREALDDGRLPDPRSTTDLGLLVDGEQLLVSCGALPEGFVAPAQVLGEDAQPSGASEEGTPIGGVTKPPVYGSKPPVRSDRRKPRRPDPLRAPSGREGPQLVELRDMVVDDRLHFATLQAIEASIRRRRLARGAAGTDAPDLYDPDVLYWHQDFRVLLGMRYVTALAAQYGVRTDLDEVLSLPLGAAEITLEEATLVYEGISTGLAWDFPGRARGATFESPPSPTLLIDEIRDVDGKRIYKAQPKQRTVASAASGAMTADILRNTVRFGTGSHASDLLHEGAGIVPLGGKTGTTNDFKNAAFLGFVPGAVRGGYVVAGGFSVGVYVGYDDNRPMVSGGIKLAGSSGALPAWMGIATGLHEAGLLGVPSGDPVDARWPVLVPPGLQTVTVETATGLNDPEGPGTVLVLPSQPTRVAELHLDADSRPQREAPSTEDASRLDELRRRLREQRANRRPSVWDAP